MIDAEILASAIKNGIPDIYALSHPSLTDFSDKDKPIFYYRTKALPIFLYKIKSLFKIKEEDEAIDGRINGIYQISKIELIASGFRMHDRRIHLEEI